MSENLNDLLRRGLARPTEPDQSFRQRTSDMGVQLDVTNIGQVLEDLDDGPEDR